MEGQPFLMVLAGLGVSLAGFSSLLTLFRADNSWDPVSLWRAKTIVRVWDLGLPAGIFADVVEEFRPGDGLHRSTGDDSANHAKRS